MEVTPDWVRIGIDAFEILWMIGASIYLFFTRRHLANKNSIKETNADVGDLKDRVIKIETQLASVPGSRDVGEIHMRITQVGQGLSRVEGTVSQMNTTLQLIQRSLMERD